MIRLIWQTSLLFAPAISNEYLVFLWTNPLEDEHNVSISRLDNWSNCIDAPFPCPITLHFSHHITVSSAAVNPENGCLLTVPFESLLHKLGKR